MNKYNNEKMNYDGKKFDSKKEMQRYMELKLLEKAGLISDLKCQVPFELIPTQREPGKVVHRGGVDSGRVLEYPVKYIADFTYKQGGKTVVEDTKGVRTPDYIIKRKLMLWVHGIRILEI